MGPIIVQKLLTPEISFPHLAGLWVCISARCGVPKPGELRQSDDSIE